MLIYVLPIPKELRGSFPARSRLYAYPVTPELPAAPGGIIILDSGAFGLSARGKHMNAEYMRELDAHYRAFGASVSPPIIAIAPDCYLNPTRTMRQWQSWHDLNYTPVAPVIQFPKENAIDLYSARKQMQCYRASTPRFVAVSNPGLRGIEAQQHKIDFVFKMISQELNAPWIHVLGAGWDRDDILAWSRIGGFNSMDSIAYYTAARDGVAWDGDTSETWVEIAKRNARMAHLWLGGTG